MYDRGRFFTMSGEHLGGTPTSIEDRQAAVEALYREHFEKDRTKKSGEHRQKKKTTTTPLSEAEIARIQDALTHISAFDYEVWLRVGMALHDAFRGSSQGYQVWLDWSRTCPDKFDELECKRKWKSFNGEGVTLGTLFEYAFQAGWNGAGHTHTGVEQEGGEVEQFNLTELGNAERFISQHGEEVRYCNPFKEWVVWDGKRWARDNAQAVKLLGKKTVRRIYKEASDIEDESDRRKMVAHAVRSEAKKAIDAMLGLAQMHVPILPEHLDADPWVLNVANGTVDLRTGKLRPHRKDDLLSRIVSIEYDPDARAPSWEEFLLAIFKGNEELIDWLWRVIGYCLTGLTYEQIFFLCWGIGSNGKSTFLKIFQALLGEYAAQSSFRTFLNIKSDAVRNDLARIAYARLVAATESEDGSRLAESFIKTVTGGDKVVARFLFKEEFEYDPQFKVWLATNHKPTIVGTDHALWRRVKLIPFNVIFYDKNQKNKPQDAPEQDKTLPDKLKAELSGILAWAIRGCLEWQQKGLTPEPEIVKTATKEYREEQDVLALFISENCLEKEGYTAPSTEFYQRYLAWSKINNAPDLSQTALATRMKVKGFVNERSTVTGKKQWLGIALIPL